MRSWLLSNTTYGTWLPGQAGGSVTRVRDLRPGDPDTPFRFAHNIPGEPWEDSLPQLRRAAAEQMKGPPIYLDIERAETALPQYQETATFRGWTLRAVAIMYNHHHLVVQVPDDPSPDKIRADFKAYATRALNRKFGQPPSKTWWTGKGSMRKLKDEMAIAAAIYYVLYKQPRPLLVWSSELGRLV